MTKTIFRFVGTCILMTLFIGTLSSCSLRAKDVAIPEDFYDVYIKAISPDGSKILLLGAKDSWQMYDYYLADPDTLDFTVMNLPENSEDISFSQDGKSILFRLDREISVLRTDDNVITTIYDKALIDGASPCFSPGGGTVYFLGEDSQLYRRSLAAQDNILMTDFKVAQFFIPGDGSNILLQNKAEPMSELLVMNSDSGSLNKIADLESEKYSFVISPDGSKILMYSVPRKELFFIDVAKGTLAPLPFDSERCSPFPFQFAPGGNRILIGSSFGEDPIKLYSMNFDGTDRVLVYDTPIFDYRVSRPDQKIVCVGNIGGHKELYTLNADGSLDQTIPLAEKYEFFDEQKLHFSASGERFYYSEGSLSAIYMMRSDSSKIRKVTKYLSPFVDKNDPPPGYTCGTDHCEQ